MTEILLFLVGLLVGGMNAIAGGGTLVGFPVLIATGLSPLVANATSHFVVLPGLLSSAYGYRKYLRKMHKRYLLLTIPTTLGGALGALILRHTPSDQFQKIVPGLVFFAVILFALQPFLHHHLHLHIKNKSKRLKPLVWISIAFFPISIYGGYFGAGFGFLMLAFLGFTKLNQIHQMNGLKSIGGICVSIASILALLGGGLIHWKSGISMGLGTLLGGYYGSKLSQKISTHLIRIAVVIIGFVTAAYLGLRSY